MAERFDAKTYVPDQASSGLSGAIMFHRLAFPDPSARIADDASWWRWLVLDACVAKYGSGGAVLEAIGSN